MIRKADSKIRDHRVLRDDTQGELLVTGSTVDKSSGRPTFERRNLRLGVDYGTSRSKLVLTDYNAADGERSFVVRPTDVENRDEDFRIPSSVSLEKDTLYFGFRAECAESRSARVYRSLKMQCAYPDAYYGDTVEFPLGLSPYDLATLYVGYLIMIGKRAAQRYAAKHGAQYSLGVTLGAPMAQLDDGRIQEMFVSLVREANELTEALHFDDGVTLRDAKRTLTEIRAELTGSVPPQPRDWVRSEAEAALFWAYNSPDIAPGRYSFVDVGAGTTNASWFHITAQRSDDDVLRKQRMAFYGSACAPPGCDAIDSVLSKDYGLPTVAEARGVEDSLLKQAPESTRTAVVRVLDRISDVYAKASERAYQREQTSRAWHNVGRVFLIGGGNKIEAVRQQLVASRKNWLQTNPIAEPGIPASLTEENGEALRDDPDFLLVAYGLARRLGDAPDISASNEIPPWKPDLQVRERLHHEDIYFD